MSGLKAFFTNPVTIRSAQVVIGVLFLLSALAKLGDIKSFALQVHNFRILPIAAENLVAITLPWIELMAGLALVLGVRARSGGLVATTMVAVFTVAVISAVARGLDFECGCFGTADSTHVGATKIAQNFGMLAVACVAAVRPRA
jgi:uncharacterized membrane protein YphA (DoxX/SURF4 family)